MTETQILLTITHKKPLPPEATDIIAQRFYGWAYSKGCEVGVTASIVDLAPLQVIEADHDHRCIGHGAGPTGHQTRADCVNCARRTAPRAGYRFMDPPAEFPCPARIAA